MFHPLSILDHVPTANALEMDEMTLNDILRNDGAIWEVCSGRSVERERSPMVQACSTMLGPCFDASHAF